MQESLTSFQQQFNKKKILMANQCLNKIVHGFTCYSIIQENLKDQINEIKKLKNESKIIVINTMNYPDNQQLIIIIIFDQTILFIQKQIILLILNLINNSKESIIITFSRELYSINANFQIKFIDNESHNFQEISQTI